MTTTKERRAMFLSRTCYVCQKPIEDGDGCFHADLRILSHQGDCGELVDGYRRVFNRSRRGRWRPRTEVLRLIESLRDESNP